MSDLRQGREERYNRLSTEDRSAIGKVSKFLFICHIHWCVAVASELRSLGQCRSYRWSLQRCVALAKSSKVMFGCAWPLERSTGDNLLLKSCDVAFLAMTRCKRRSRPKVKVAVGNVFKSGLLSRLGLYTRLTSPARRER